MEYKDTYRIKVEKRPNELFKRFYPEVKKYVGNSTFTSWTATQKKSTGNPIWFSHVEKAERHIDNIINGQPELNNGYVVEILSYPKPTVYGEKTLNL